MSPDWCPGIREACAHWRDAPMLQQTFEALERTLDQDNDACIDCSKTVVAVVCQTIGTGFHRQQNRQRPPQEPPTLRFLLPGGDELPIKIEVSRLLYLLDRGAYVEALNAARGVPAPVAEHNEEQEGS